MGQFKIKRNKYDITFSEFIKLRDRVCQKCGKSTGQLECSHIFSRRHIGIRWDADNAKLLCGVCHRDYHSNPVESAEWLKGIIGENKYNRLRIKANTVAKLKSWDKDEIRKIHLENIEKIKSGIIFKCFNRLYQVG